eukprot:COSAG01_NODE_5684_length_4102_cov_2.406695_4_plen_56_part_00
MDRSAGKTEFSVRLTRNGHAEEETIPDIAEDAELPVFASSRCEQLGSMALDRRVQ